MKTEQVQNYSEYGPSYPELYIGLNDFVTRQLSNSGLIEEEQKQIVGIRAKYGENLFHNSTMYGSDNRSLEIRLEEDGEFLVTLEKTKTTGMQAPYYIQPDSLKLRIRDDGKTGEETSTAAVSETQEFLKLGANLTSTTIELIIAS